MGSRVMWVIIKNFELCVHFLQDTFFYCVIKVSKNTIKLAIIENQNTFYNNTFGLDDKGLN